MNTFENYYTTQFPRDIQNYYDINYSHKSGYTIVLFMEDSRNKVRENFRWKDQSHFNMFSISMFCTSIGAQIIGHLYSWEVMEDFHRASGWPMMSCGLGGILPSIRMLEESNLLPSKLLAINNPSIIDEYINTLHTASGYLINDLVSFLSQDSHNLNQEAYRRLCSIAVAEDVKAEALKQFQLFEKELKGINVDAKEYGLFQSGLYVTYPHEPKTKE